MRGFSVSEIESYLAGQQIGIRKRIVVSLTLKKKNIILVVKPHHTSKGHLDSGINREDRR